MPSLALKPSTAHCVARMPLRPGAAAIPARGARMPIRSGLFCAIAGANTPPDTDTAPTAAADASSFRREIAMSFLPFCSGLCLSRRYIRRMPPTSDRRLCRGLAFQKRFDLRSGQLPVVVKIGHHFFHETVGKRDRALLVAQKVIKDRKRQLLWAVPFIGPLKAVPCEALDVIVF